MELGIALKQSRSLGIKQPILGPHEAEEQSVLDTAGKAAEGLAFFSPALPKKGQAAERFRASFRARFGTEPGVLAANSFDATHLAVAALRECNASGSCACDRLHKVADYPGVSGTFSIMSDGGTVKSFERRVVENGKYVAAGAHEFSAP